MNWLLAQFDGATLVENSTWDQWPALTLWGAALAHFVWQGTVLALLAVMLLRMLKRARPQLRYAALVGVLAVMAACPAATLWWIAAETRPAPNSLAAMNEKVRVEATAPSGQRLPPAADFMPDPTETGWAMPYGGKPEAALPSWGMALRKARAALRVRLHWFVLAWFAGVAVLSLRLVAGIIGIERAKRRGARRADAIETTVATLARRLCVSRPVRVLESTVAEVPTVVGWLRPYILLPASAMTGLTTAELDAVLAHELAHVRRHDYLVNVAQIVVETLLFYHPGVWWLSGRIRREREHCCDDCAVAICGNRLTYARALVALEGMRGPVSGLVLAANGTSLRERVLRLVGRSALRSTNDSGWWAAAGVLLVAVAAAAIGVAVSTRADETMPPNTGSEPGNLDPDQTGPLELEIAETQANARESRIEPAKKKTELSGKQLRIKTRKSQPPKTSTEVVVEVDGPATLTINRPGGPEFEIVAERISLTLDAEVLLDLAGDQLSASLPLDAMALVSCRGKVRFRRGEISMMADEIEIDLQQGKLVATEVQSVQGDGSFKADRLEYRLASGAAEEKDTGATDPAHIGIQLKTGELPLELVADAEGEAAAVEGNADGPVEAVTAFLNAVRSGDSAKASAMLTRLAREKTAEFDMAIAPPGSKTASFKVGEAKMVSAEESEGNDEMAHVASTWTDIKDGKPRTDEIVWALRDGPEGWRIAGMATKIFADQPPLLLNFEDPQDMQRKQEQVQAEMERRARAAPEKAVSIREAVDRGVAYVKSRQNAENGGWQDVAGFPGGVSALCTLALLKSGIGPDDEAIQKALARLRPLPPSMTYSTALATMVFCAAEPERDRERIERNVKWFENSQKRDGAMAGAWAYPKSDGDNSNSGFAVLALYDAEQKGVKADRQTWRRASDYWVRTQNQDGSWGYKPGLPGTGSMTSSGIVSLAAALEVLGENVPAGAGRVALDRGMDWLGRNFALDSNPGAHGKGWLLYYLREIGRAGTLAQQRLIGGHDWYQEGSELLLGTQDKLAGFWVGTGHVEDHAEVGTSFALLFLSERRTREK